MLRLHFLIPGLTATLLGCSGSPADGAAEDNPTDVVFNELEGAGTEWLELYNIGGDAVDLGACAVTDTDKDTGLARIVDAMRFPTGTTLAPRAVLLVLLGKKDSTPGPYPAAACLPQVDSSCFYAAFSISEARGEAVHLLAPDDTTLSSVTYPADLAFEAGSAASVCRLPDGTGALTACTGTPGAPNAAQ